jgi:hypothetical protein
MLRFMTHYTKPSSLCLLPKLHGVITKAGNTAAGQEVVAVASGVAHRTFTNAKGEYRFFERMSGKVATTTYGYDAFGARVYQIASTMATTTYSFKFFSVVSR